MVVVRTPFYSGIAFVWGWYVVVVRNSQRCLKFSLLAATLVVGLLKPITL